MCCATKVPFRLKSSSLTNSFCNPRAASTRAPRRQTGRPVRVTCLVLAVGVPSQCPMVAADMELITRICHDNLHGTTFTQPCDGVDQWHHQQTRACRRYDRRAASHKSGVSTRQIVQRLELAPHFGLQAEHRASGGHNAQTPSARMHTRGTH